MSSSEIPCYGWKAKLDYKFPQKRTQKLSLTWSQLFHMIPLFIRYLWYWTRKMISGRRAVMDFICVAKNYCHSGIPVGGIGGGTIGRSFKGYFYDNCLVPGMYEPSVARVMHFIVTVQNVEKKTIYQSVLSGDRDINRSVMPTWEWNTPPKNIEYTALYPRAWTEYKIPQLNLILICRQINPIIPHNYKDSCIPGGVFEWIIKNNSDDPLYVSITSTMSSCEISFDKPFSESFDKTNEKGSISGIMIHASNAIGKFCFAVAGLKKEKTDITKCTFFNPKGSGSEVWDSLKKYGELKEYQSTYESCKDVAVAICSKTLVNNSDEAILSFSIVWDMPVLKFPRAKRSFKRYYTKFFGDSGEVAPELSIYSLTNYPDWEDAIESWQGEILKSEVPDWYKSAIFNELYYVSRGGTIWILLDDNEKNELPSDDPRTEYGRFAYLEGLEYRMYNTYDVHFYASFALAMLWPKLQLSLQYDYRDTIDFEDCTKIWYLADGKTGFRKIKGSVPHDLGDSDEAPFDRINSYPSNDVSTWKDLNLKFVLQVYRDYIIINPGVKYINDMFSQLTTIMRRALTWDVDGDGMIENSGEIDQTYDSWIMSGTSAYCGSLWLAALIVYIEMADILKETAIFKEFSDILDKAKDAFDRKLWTGNYFRFDSSNSRYSDSIMADQLCGLWYLSSSKIKQKVISESKVKQSLATVYNSNVSAYYNGEQGAVNGMLPDMQVDRSSVQSAEVWTGVSYGLASMFYYEGMISEAFKTARGVYTTIYEKSGLGFETPEALHQLDSFRALGYMRPLSIWSLQLAIQNSKSANEIEKK